MSCDLKYFFLETPRSRADYMRIYLKNFPPDIRYQYKIDGIIAAYGYVYMKTIKGMYGLKQAATIAYNQIIYHMEPHIYYPVSFTTGLWEHNIGRKKWCLYMDDFGAKYFTKDDANHLLDALKNHFAISIDWEGHNYLGLKIYWNYGKEYVDTSMSEYAKKALDGLQYPKPKIP